MTKLVAQSVINSFFDGKHADPFAVLGMHETHNGIVCKCPYHLNNLLKNLAFRFPIMILMGI